MKPLKLLLFLLAVPAALVAGAQSGIIRPGSITMSPSNPASNTDVTICFDVSNNSNGMTVRVAVGFAPSGFALSTQNANQVNWVLDESGVYRGNGSLTVNGISQAIASNNYTDVAGPSSGVAVGTSNGAWKTVCFQTHIPPEFAGNYTLLVVANEASNNLQMQSCGTMSFSSDANGALTTSFNVSGTSFVRLNLQVCNAGSCAPNAICFEYRVTNYGESGVRLNGLDIKFCIYDTNTSWCAQDSSNTFTSYPNGTQYCNTFNPSNQFSFQWFSTVDCGAGGKTNGCYHYTLNGGPVSQSMPYYVPPNGGYTQSNSPAIYFRHCDGSAHSTGSDFTSLATAAACGSGWTSVPGVTLWNNGSLVCEYDGSSSQDQASGVPHCGSTSGCNDCPSNAVNNMAKNAWGNSNVSCVPIYSPTVTPTSTPTPAMALTKTASQSVATIGDTVTFCIAWKNDASSAKDMQIWDTVPANISYLGCSNACGGTASNVSWDLGMQAAGASGQVCFWGTVSSYPWVPGLLDRETAALSPAGGAERLYRGLWAPLALPDRKD